MKVKRLLGAYNGRSPIFVLALMVLFWTIFDSALAYVTPILLEEQGFSTSMIGFIIGTSSITGAVFDFVICKFFKNINFRRIFLAMFAVCLAYPLILWQAKTIWMFLFAMAVWGVYYDLYGFGVFDFVGRCTQKENNSANFGIIQIFRALGGILAPLIIGLIVVSHVDWRTFALSWIFLGIAFLFFLILIGLVGKKHPLNDSHEGQGRRKNLLVELHLWKKIGKIMLPVLVLTCYLLIIEAFFWTLGPLYAETVNFQSFGGLFLTAFSLHALLMGWFVGPITKRFGKKKTACTGLLVGSLILSSFAFWSHPVLIIGMVFLASCFISMAFPSINGAYADYIAESPEVEGEIEGLEDLSVNVGYIFGPLFAGLLADSMSMSGAFTLLGGGGVILACVLLFVMPKSIVIHTDPSEL